jgi:light-harvesting complex 1 beta chain
MRTAAGGDGRANRRTEYRPEVLNGCAASVVANIPAARAAAVTIEYHSGVMKMADPKLLSGLTDAEARDFHSQFQTTFSTFLLIAAAAHALVWFWKPWF